MMKSKRGGAARSKGTPSGEGKENGGQQGDERERDREAQGNVNVVLKNMKKFDGGEDIDDWLARLKIVGEMNDVNDLAKVIPLLLEGKAFGILSEHGGSGEEKTRKGRKRAA